MELHVLGRYSPYPPLGGACVSYIVSAGPTKVLLECGSGAVSRLQARGGWQDLDCVILSHLHGDHMSDMLVLRYAIYLDILTEARREPLIVYCPSEPARERELLDYKGALRVIPVSAGDSLQIGGLAVEFAPAVHPMTCHSMRFTHGNKTLVYSGDTEPNPDLANLSQGATMLLCEATLSEYRRSPGHFVARELGRFARDAGVGKLVVTHFGAGHDTNKVMADVRENFLEAIEAEEGKTYPA